MRRLLAVAMGLAAMAPAARVAAEPVERPSSLALYQGRVIDLSESWAGAGACWIGEPGNECYVTYGEMLRDHPEIPAVRSDGDAGDVFAVTACSSAVQLFDGTGFSGAAIALATQNDWLYLSTWGFSGRTSSYAVGACGSQFKDATTTYPGSTGAWASASSMLSGWDNRITRIWIY